MGACFNAMVVDGKASQQEVAEQFNSRCEQDSRESGNSYSGSFSQFEGLRFTDKHFATYAEAVNYVSDHGEKWGPAVAVRYMVIEQTKRMEAHQKAIDGLNRKVNIANTKVYNARDKMRVNNRSTKPSYVTKTETNLERVKSMVDPKIAERKKAISEIEQKLAAKSKKSNWILGGWCSS